MRIIFFLLILLFCSCSNIENKSQKIKGEILEISKEKMDLELNTFGTISYNTKNYISTQVSGVLENFNIHEGEKISKGQILANLSNVQLSIQKDQCVANVEQAESNLNQCMNIYNNSKLNCTKHLLNLEKEKLRILQQEKELEYMMQQLDNSRKIHKLGGIANQNLKQSELEVENLQISLEIAKKEFEIMEIGYRNIDLLENGIDPSQNKEILKEQIIKLNTKNELEQLNQSKSNLQIAKNELKSVNKLIKELIITSPVDGIAAGKAFENGEFVKENETIITILDTAQVIADCSIQEKDIYKIKIGMDSKINIVSLQKTIDSKITEINPVADPVTGSFRFKSTIQNQDEILKPGMFVKSTIHFGYIEDLWKIPQESLKTRNGSLAEIFTLQDNKAFSRQVEVVNEKDGFCWVKIQEPGDSLKIINQPSPFIMEGTYVEEN